jgi:hypothetical protein
MPAQPARLRRTPFIVGVIVVLITVVIMPRVRVPGGVNGSALGWMSEQWLAEHRASHSA